VVALGKVDVRFAVAVVEAVASLLYRDAVAPLGLLAFLLACDHGHDPTGGAHRVLEVSGAVMRFPAVACAVAIVAGGFRP